jgi:phosphoribosylglycinamide formyltransferase-1
MIKKIILFASGSGTNVENICRFFEHDDNVEIVKVFTNNPKAGVLNRIKSFDVEFEVFDKTTFTNGRLLNEIKTINPDLIILAGFLWKIGADWVQAFPSKIINIHPALLPKYGGKGMYGRHIHKAVKENNEHETGITIHYVNEEYDKGDFIFQTTVSLSNQDQESDIANKIQLLEQQHFPKIIASLLYKDIDEI